MLRVARADAGEVLHRRRDACVGEPAARTPRTARATAAVDVPNVRCSAAMNDPAPGTSATGARSTLTPAARECQAGARASARMRRRAQPRRARAAGSAGPAHGSRRTLPPSWSVAIRSGGRPPRVRRTLQVDRESAQLRRSGDVRAEEDDAADLAAADAPSRIEAAVASRHRDDEPLADELAQVGSTRLASAAERTTRRADHERRDAVDGAIPAASAGRDDDGCDSSGAARPSRSPRRSGDMGSGRGAPGRESHGHLAARSRDGANRLCGRTAGRQPSARMGPTVETAP